MTEQQHKGRTPLLCYSAAILAISVTTISTYVAVRGTGNLPRQFTRFVLTAALLLWLYRGSKVARIISIVLYSVGGLFAAGTLLISNGSLGYLLMEFMAFTYISFAGLLFASLSMNDFLTYQRQRNTSRPLV